MRRPAGADPDGLTAALGEVRPRLRGHAGDLRVVESELGVLTAVFEGACESCPAMAVTCAGLMRTRLAAVPGVDRVEAPQVNASPRTLRRIELMLGATSARENEDDDGA